LAVIVTERCRVQVEWWPRLLATADAFA